ncbi:C5a anaphylatoxin chemotactic receptor 1-like [Puntigrus tetrazona]|uniref:C5a anaphylatoxin chemotactic receptor 1-like n=1 Tax=Puntigrus tetrazona TaxID=1606681 RepID=UPI001C8AC213|nr:C5a anaphylatoxin chemotactic receptor 1-like [Puntigrus tetrazona]XP_043114493.1 C5a anaphylatoxin chemotactic receptor 1-like [Puntigrus tetrazona]
MNNSTLNFTTPETSTNSTVGPLDYIEISALSISFLFGVPTNVYVLWLILTGTGSGVASEFFMLNLSVCEICTSLNNLVSLLPFYVASLKLLPMFLQGLILTGRPLFQCLICVEHYLAVVHPVTFLKYKPLRYRVICCAVAWIITLGSCFYCLFIVIAQNTQAEISFFSTHFLLLTFFQLFFLVAILRALKQSGPGGRGREREEENHMKRRAFYLILITTVSMTITYAPYAITGFSVLLTGQNTHIYWVPASICYILAGFVQPILYLHRAGNISWLCYP